MSISPSMNPNKRQEVTVSYCCSIAFIKTKFQQNTILQQPSTSTNSEIIRSQKPKCNGYGCHRLSMLSIPVEAIRMPRFLACPAIYGSKIGPKTSQE